MFFPLLENQVFEFKEMSVLLTYIFILDGVDVRNEIEIGTNAIGKYVTDPYHFHIRQL